MIDATEAYDNALRERGRAVLLAVVRATPDTLPEGVATARAALLAEVAKCPPHIVNPIAQSAKP